MMCTAYEVGEGWLVMNQRRLSSAVDMIKTYLTGTVRVASPSKKRLVPTLKTRPFGYS